MAHLQPTLASAQEQQSPPCWGLSGFLSEVCRCCSWYADAPFTVFTGRFITDLTTPCKSQLPGLHTLKQGSVDSQVTSVHTVSILAGNLAREEIKAAGTVAPTPPLYFGLDLAQCPCLNVPPHPNAEAA